MDEEPSGRGGGGESGGGPYPNPHRGKDGFMGSGGQTGKAYHGDGKLGDEDVGSNPNAPAENEGD
jgi:hypothetical protein